MTKPIDKIRKALKELKGEGYGNACHIFKGYDVATNQSGYHYIPFGETAIYLGTNVKQIVKGLQPENTEFGY